MPCVAIFFFFQAEDGIRDIGVTGVQTCALPILHGAMVAEGFGDAEGELLRRVRAVAGAGMPLTASLDPHAHMTAERSEERRVGEEGRSRWSPDTLKKKKKAIGHSHTIHTILLVR